eukprot:946911-Rhodomonas_salina.11
MAYAAASRARCSVEEATRRHAGHVIGHVPYTVVTCHMKWSRGMCSSRVGCVVGSRGVRSWPTFHTQDPAPRIQNPPPEHRSISVHCGCSSFHRPSSTLAFLAHD